MTLQFTAPHHAGHQFDFAYTLGKSEDNAPITSSCRCRATPAASDPTNLDRDLGPNVLDQRHTFVGSIVAIAATSSATASPAPS